MTTQTAFTEDFTPLVVGQIYDEGLSDILSRKVEDAAGIGFGLAVFQGTADEGVTATPAAAGFVGVTARYHAIDAATPTTFGQYAVPRVVKKGPAAVAVSVAVDAGDAAFFVTASGLFTNVDDANTTAIPGGVFESTTAQNGIAKLRIS